MSCSFEIDSHGGERFQIDVLDVGRRRFQNHLHLVMLFEAIGIFAVAPVGGTARRFDIGDLVWFGTEHAKKRFRMHGAGADFNIVRLLQHAASLPPEIQQRLDEVLKFNMNSTF